MIGESYLTLRQRVGGELRTLAQTVRAFDDSPESSTTLDHLLASLDDPFVFVTVGETGVGKSTFLNALFGHDFARRDAKLPAEKIRLFTHGETPETQELNPLLAEIKGTAPFLKNFHIVDLSNTHSATVEHQQIIERFVPIADLVIFVFSATNPWDNAAWQFLDKVHHQWTRHVVFVLQQCDLRTAEEIRVITDYMGQLSRQRHGREFPIFAVSAKKAALAQSSGIDRERLLEESGFPVLEKHLSEQISRSGARLDNLRRTLQIARQVLDHLQSRIAVGARQSHRITELIHSLLTERELQIERTAKKILPALDATERDLHEAGLRTAGLADEQLTFRSLFQKANPQEGNSSVKPQSLDHRLLQDLQAQSGERWRQMGLVFEEDCLQYARFLHVEGRGRLFPVDSPLPASDTLPDMRRRFSTHTDSTLRRFVLELKLDEILEAGQEKARRSVRLLPWFSLLSTGVIAAATAWYGGVGAGGAAIFCVLLLGLLLFRVQLQLHRTRQEILDRLQALSPELRLRLSEQVRNDIDAFFARFLPWLEPAQTEAAEQEHHRQQQLAALKPLADGLAQLEADSYTL